MKSAQLGFEPPVLRGARLGGPLVFTGRVMTFLQKCLNHTLPLNDGCLHTRSDTSVGPRAVERERAAGFVLALGVPHI